MRLPEPRELAEAHAVLTRLSTRDDLGCELTARETTTGNVCFGGRYIQIAGTSRAISGMEVYVRIGDPDQVYQTDTTSGPGWLERSLRVLPLAFVSMNMLNEITRALEAVEGAYPAPE